MSSNISLCSSLYWYANLKSCKYLKNETHLWNALVNKASYVKKGIVKICLVVVMVRKNGSWIVVANCGLHYFVSARFDSFSVFANLSTAKRFKYLFYTAMKVHIMGCIVRNKPTLFLVHYLHKLDRSVSPLLSDME